ncbi:MAG TPA: pentapeptide repeat-containing protein, partial [Micavibrio sp.]|nr:pentapeptide repeat-containing protein [Micavibrio sp.]
MDKLSQEALESIIAGHQKYIKGMRGGVRAVIKFKDLSGVVIKGRDMSNSDFSGCIFDDADLSGSNFTASSFFACDLKRTNMAHGNFSKCDFRGAC